MGAEKCRDSFKVVLSIRIMRCESQKLTQLLTLRTFKKRFNVLALNTGTFPLLCYYIPYAMLWRAVA